MRPTAPEAIAVDEEEAEDGVGLRRAGDLAPHLGHADVILTGRAALPPGSEGVTVRLTVTRDRRLLLEKELDFDRPEPPADRLSLGGMGPLSRHWPARTRLLGDLDPAALAGPVLAIPDAFDWSYFQAAPLDQRIELLHGDEWMGLGGVDPASPWTEARLPGALGVARLYSTAASLRQGRAVPLAADTLHVDVDQRCCSVVWRGSFPVSGEDAFPSLHVVAGLEMPGARARLRQPLRDDPGLVRGDPVARSRGAREACGGPPLRRRAGAGARVSPARSGATPARSGATPARSPRLARPSRRWMGRWI